MVIWNVKNEPRGSGKSTKAIQVLLEEYCENDYSAKLYESCCSVKKV